MTMGIFPHYRKELKHLGEGLRVAPPLPIAQDTRKRFISSETLNYDEILA